MRPILVFDGDCGMCTRAAGLVERSLRIRPEDYDVTPSQALDLPSLGLTSEQAMAALQWVGPDGSIASGHAAIAAMLRRSRLWARPAGVVLTAPVISWVAARAYDWVARHRHLFPGGTPACALSSPADRP